MRIIFIGLLFFTLKQLNAQVGVGTNMPNQSAMLDIVSTNKGLLIPRVSLIDTTDTSTILNGNVIGLIVFNNLSRNDITTGFYYWDGVKWLKLAESTGGSATVNATNGVSQLSNGDLVLGGTLNSPTTITTSTINTLLIQGLATGNNTVDEVVSINPTSGVLSKIPLSSTTQQLEVLHIAADGQVQFLTPSNYTNISKVSVYRNGVKLGLTSVDSNTIALESGVICNPNDEIRIIQLN